MKTIKLYFSIIALFFLCLFVSCTQENVEPEQAVNGSQLDITSGDDTYSDDDDDDDEEEDDDDD